MESRCGESIARGVVDKPRRCDSGSSRRSCSRKHAPGCLKSRRKSGGEEDDEGRGADKVVRSNSCYDMFALAKRLHAENLQHQPLPDKVDDIVFKNMTVAAHRHRSCSAACDAKYRGRADILRREHLAPALGCKEPKTRMDLAICWETPVDPVYEPRRSTHIDGSDGGSAPAIFALIQHTPAPRNRELLAGEAPDGQQQGDQGGCGCAGEKLKRETGSGSRCCCESLCDRMESVAMAEVVAEPPRSAKSATRARSVPRITERRCVACESAAEAAEKRRRDPRLIRSAVGIALGIEGKRDDVLRRNGLPPVKAAVPRPRTPFARRTFCIDTLAPPFSVVHGCRDADYPEHWRLMSVYQQSYRSPQKRRARHF